MTKYNTDKVVKLQGKEYILFEGLLEIAHKDYKLMSIEPEVLQLPNKENGQQAVVKAVVRTEDGKTFVGHGDADPTNVNKMIAKHLIRMAETRAVGRALRMLTGFGTVFEELGDMNEQKDEKAKEDLEKARETLIHAIKGYEFEFGEIVTNKVKELEGLANKNFEDFPFNFLQKAKQLVEYTIKESQK